MADVFRGLTIRIGADTQPLQSALNSVKSSASVTQKFLKQMQGSLKFDNTNVRAIGKGIELAGDRASFAARQLNLVERAIQQAYGKTVEFSKVSGVASAKFSDLAADTDRVHSATMRVRTEYNRVNTELAHIYESSAKVLAKQENISESKALKEIRKLAKAAQDTGKEAEEAQTKLKNLMHTAVLQNVKGIGENNQMGIRERFGFTGAADEAWKLWDVYHRLQSEHGQLEADLKELNGIAVFENLKAQGIAYESEVRQLVAEMGEFASKMAVMGVSSRFPKLINDAKTLDTAFDMTAEAARKAQAAFDAMPGNADAAKAAIRGVEQQSQLLKDKIANLEAQYKELADNHPWAVVEAETKNAYLEAQKAQNEYNKLGAELKKAEDNAKLLKDDLEGVGRNNGTKKTQEEIEQLKIDVDKAKESVEELSIKFMSAGKKLEQARITEQVAKTNSELIETKGHLERVNAQMRTMSRSGQIFGALRTMGYGIYSTLTPLISIGLGKMVQAAETVDSAYRDMRKTVNGTEEEFEHLKEAAIEFSRTHVTTADTILEIEALGGQLGIQARNLEGFSNVVSNLDIATNIDSDDLATYVGQLSNIMRDINQNDPSEYQKNITSFSDALVRLGNNSAAQESNIMKVMMRIASLGNISGFTTPQLLAISTAVAATGQGAEAAGTAISRTFSNIEAAVGKGGDKLEQFAKVSGMSAQEFSDAWNNDPKRAFTAFIGGLKKIDESGGSVDRTLAELDINSVRQKQALEGLTNTYDVLTNSLNMAQEAWNGQESVLSDGSIEAAGDAAREAQRKSEGFSGAIQMMRNNATALAESMGDGLMPIVQAVGGLLEWLTGEVTRLNPGIKTFSVGLLGVIAAIGPAAIAIGAVGNGFERIREISAAMESSRTLKGVRGAFEGIQSVFTKVGDSSKYADTRIGKLSSSLGKMSTLKFAGIATGVLVAIGAIKSLVDYFQEVAEHQREVQEGFDSLNRETARSTSLDDYAAKVNLVGTNSYSSAKALEELSNKFREHSDVMKANNDAAEATIASMNTVEEVVDEYAGAAARGVEYDKLSATEKGKVEYALRQLESQLGLTIAAQDLLNGTYKDEEGNVKSLTDEIRKLADAKREEARVSAISENMSEAYKAQRDALKALETEQREYREDYDKWYSYYLEEGYDEQQAAEIAESLASNSHNVEELSQQYEKASDAVEEYAKELGAATGETGKISDALSGFGSDFVLSLTDAGVSMSDFAIALANAGVSADSLKTLGSEAFLQLFNMAGSTTSGIINALNLMAAAGVSDINQLADGTWNLDAAAGVLTGQDHVFRITDNGAVVDMMALVNQLNANAEDTEQGYTIDYDSGQVLDAQGNVVDLETALSQIDGQTYSASIAIDTSAADRSIDALIGRINSARQAAANAGRNASGGISYSAIRAFASGALVRSALRAIPRNASGGLNGIVTRATMTNVGWVGEAGDEAVLNMRHAGGAIIPLSNRQHVRPFARAVAAEIPYGGSSTVYNFSVDGATINDDPHMRGLFIELLFEMQRKAAMNRG